jgi:hypothetical protein
MSRIDLEIRETHKYVGPYRHLDRWREIGWARVIESGVVEKDWENPEETTVTRTVLTVHSEAPEAEIEQAIRDVFTKEGCAHEYDCCGCWSSYAQKPRKLSPGCWEVKVSSSRNY